MKGRDNMANKEHYLEVNRRLHVAIPRKHKCGSWKLHHDNAAVRTSLLVSDFLVKIKHAILPRPQIHRTCFPVTFYSQKRRREPEKDYIWPPLMRLKPQRYLSHHTETLPRLEKTLTQVYYDI